MSFRTAAKVDAAAGNPHEQISVCYRCAPQSGRSGFRQLRSNSAGPHCAHCSHSEGLGPHPRADVPGGAPRYIGMGGERTFPVVLRVTAVRPGPPLSLRATYTPDMLGARVGRTIVT